MTLTTFQNKCLESAIYPNKGNNIIYPVLGLCGESGELAEKVKKVLRDASNIWSENLKEAAIKELGDVLWYASAIAFEFGVTLDYVGERVLIKLEDRKNRNVLSGSGDNR